MKPLNVSSDSEQGMQWAHAQINQMAAAGRLDLALNRNSSDVADRARKAISDCAQASIGDRSFGSRDDLNAPT